jgi:flagellar protein FliS
MTYGRLDAYETVGALTADPARLVLMLFDGALRFLQKARRALDAGDVATFAQAMSRAHAIVGELAEALKEDAVGEATRNLAGLYRFMLIHLTEGQVQKSAAHLDRVMELLRTIREGFEGALEQASRATAS